MLDRRNTVLIWLMLAQVLLADPLPVVVVVRDHLTQTSSEVSINPKLWDSTAGAWTGTRPGLDGLPTPQPYVEAGVIHYRRPLSPFIQNVGWPGRIAARLDATEGGDTHQRCSASLIGPKFALTAAHCVHYSITAGTIQDGWVADTFWIRPGFNLGKSISGFDRVRVTKTWVARSKFPGVPKYAGDDEWAILELDQDVGTELGWARVTPINYKESYQWIHMMGYPFIPPKCPGTVCDTATKTDTLCHSWSDMYFQPDVGTVQAWVPMAEAWEGESGSGAFHCPDDSCHTGKIDVVGVRWTDTGLGSFDSLMSGVVAAILKDVKVPSTVILATRPPEFSLYMAGTILHGASDREGLWQILSLDGRSIEASYLPSFGKSFAIAADHLPHGVALIVFRTSGQAPITRQWIGR